MRSPIVAMLWESWLLTRVEAAVRLGLGIVAASGALFLFDASATAALSILIVVNAFWWFSIAKVNGGRFLSGYKSGFPLRLLYTRPVRTVVLVGVAMVYDALSCAALYFVSAAVVGFALGQPLPLLSVTVWIVAFHLCLICCQWSTRSRVVLLLGTIATCLVFIGLLWNPVTSALRALSLAEYKFMAWVGLIAFLLTWVGVARQRRGGAATVPRTAGSAGYWDWLIGLVRFPCPTSSATRAQLWFELKSGGLPVLASGLAFAMLNFLLFAISIPLEFFRPFALLSVPISIFLAPAVLILGGNAFDIRRRRGRSDVSAFEATQPCGAAQLAGIKVLVRSICVLVALIVVGVGVWTASSLIGEWGPWVVEGKAMGTNFVSMRESVGHQLATGDFFGSLTGSEHAGQVFVIPIAIAMMVASRAAFTALWARYPRRVLVAVSVLFVYVLALILLARAAKLGIGSEFLLHAMRRAIPWIVVAAIAFGAAYFAWRALAERLLTQRQVWRVVLLSALFGVAFLALIGLPRLNTPGFPTMAVLWRSLVPALLALMVGVVAPWAFSRMRHT